MSKVNFEKAYYIKLGTKGEWEKESIESDKVRFGWIDVPLADIDREDWNKIRKIIKKRYFAKDARTNEITKDFNALKKICASSEDNVWITFYDQSLWWCKLRNENAKQDGISKYRKIKGSWKNTDIKGNILLINNIPGRLSQTQAFRGTICDVTYIDDLRRVINAEKSDVVKNILKIQFKLEKEVNNSLKLLYWKDFETLIDLIFKQSGWQRISMLGKSMKYMDLELLDPITEDRYMVQIKSKASLKDFQNYKENFPKHGYRKLYFVVHSPSKDLSNYSIASEDEVELILPHRLSHMIVKLGLIDWLITKVQ